MEHELVNDSCSSTEGEGSSSSPLLFTDVFEKAFPYYLSYGMSYDEYWHGEAELVRYYKQAHDLQLEEKNLVAYLQGVYVRSAISDFIEFFGMGAKHPKVGKNYPKEPVPVTKRAKREAELKKENDVANYYIRLFRGEEEAQKGETSRGERID